MKQVVNGKRYDTEASKLLAAWDNGYRRWDFDWLSESLYVTTKGNYFLHEEGGANTSLHTQKGSNWRCGGEQITTLDPPGVVEWLERRQIEAVSDLGEAVTSLIEEA